MATPDRVVDMGLSNKSLKQYLIDIGYWKGELRQKNAYVLSPSAYALRAPEKSELNKLSIAAWNALEKLGLRITELANQKSPSRADAQFVKMARGASCSLWSPELIGAQVSPVVKIDLVQGIDGRYYIAEIDAYNPRGFGYLGYLDDTISREFDRSGGGMYLLASLMHGEKESTSWLIVVSEFERFYEPVYRVFANQLAQYGLTVQVIRENALAENPALLTSDVRVFCISETFHRSPQVRALLLEHTKKSPSFYPPRAYLGSKGWLPYLAQDAALALYLPHTIAVDRTTDLQGVFGNQPFVLKASVSSGMKKVVFSDECAPASEKALAEARQTKLPSWIAQKAVQQKAQAVVVFDEAGNRLTRDYYFRITAYASKFGCLGIEITGRPDRKVHGAPDCIQIPAVLI